MRYYANECVDCDKPCIYESCPYYEVEHFCCDFCGEETKLYEYECYELCEECILKQFNVVEGSDW